MRGQTELMITNCMSGKRLDWLVVATAMLVALCLGLSNLGTPSFWHDEAVQVCVARNMAETGKPLLPSGNPHPVAPLFNAILAVFIALFGDSETVVRIPSVLASVLNVSLGYYLVRKLLGRPAALVAAVALALNPWSIGWAREARFYMFHQTFYLAVLVAAWHALAADTRKALWTWGVVACLSYLLSILVSLHSVLFLAPMGLYAGFMFLRERQIRSRWFVAGVVVGILGAVTLLGYWLSLPKHDAMAIFKESQGKFDASRPQTFFYLWWFQANLGTGFFIASMAGFALMLWREGRRGVFTALAFWIPLCILNFLIAYRYERFMFFIYPVFIASYAYAIVAGVQFCRTWRQTWWRTALCILLVLFGGRLALSGARQVGDSLRAAGGAHTTLARRHPQWREPCHYVRDRLTPDTAVVATAMLPALYYIGRVDTWFPKILYWETWETGVEGLRTVEEMETFIKAHPRGYFIAEWWAFDWPPILESERAWVKANMTRVEAASSPDVSVYAWGITE
jgi:4-amino-4-deoxy-L-arabinose transferase-like glycosyltransferase